MNALAPVSGAALRRALLPLGALNLLVALAITAPLLRGGGLTTARQVAFAVVAMAGYLGTASLAIGGLLAIASSFPRARTAILWLAPVSFTLLHTALFVDVRVYKMFRFHFNGLVWQTVTAPGGWDSLHVPTADLVALAFAVIAFAAAQRRIFGDIVRKSSDRPWLPALTWKRAVLGIAVLGVAERTTFATFDLLRDYEIARAARVVPGYQRFTVRRFAKRWFGWKPGSADLAFSGKPKASSSGLHYPVKPLAWKAPERKLNFLWVVLESWRYDAFDENHSPEIWKISKGAHVFENHISGGNNTTFGVFTMFYGLYGSYRNAFLAEHRGPVLVDRLRELDYRFAIYSSFPMTWPEFRKYAFVDIADSVKDAWPHEESAKNDPLVVDDFLSFVDRGKADGDRPFFGFLLLDSSHAPYTFPPDFAKFQPYTRDAKFVRYIDVTQRAPEMRNRYFNAVLWEDFQVGRLWRELDRRGVLDETVVLITGDHGEEFNEHGFWTHSGGYTPEQVQVPAILHWPGKGASVVTRRSGHEDIAPTILEALGVQNPPGDYSQGRSLFDETGNPYVVSCGWRDCAIIDDLGYVVFGLENHYSMSFDVLDRQYVSVADPRSALASRGDRMLSIMQELGLFLK